MSHDRDEMREKMLAYYLDALGTHEAERIRELVRIDPAWQEAAEEARLMQAGLEEACDLEEDAPRDLAARVTRDMRSPFRGASRALAAVAGVAAAALIFLGVSWLTISPSRGALLWRANDQLLAGGLLVPELVVRTPDSGEPLADVEVSASLRADDGTLIALGSGRTSDDGVLTEPWRVPDIAPGNYQLQVEARDGDTLLDSYDTTVLVRSSARLVVAPDRPAARPGEVIRVRALFKRDDGGAPMAEREITFDLVDFENNRLGHHERVTSRHGLAWTQFPLDRELPEGTYTIVARSEGVLAPCTFRLEQYRLPVYDVRIELDRSTFAESERVRGRVTARTFDGHAIEGLQVEIRHDGDQAPVMLDTNGRGEFSLEPLVSGVHGLRVDVIDAAGQRAETQAGGRVGGGVARSTSCRSRANWFPASRTASTSWRAHSMACRITGRSRFGIETSRSKCRWTKTASVSGRCATSPARRRSCRYGASTASSTPRNCSFARVRRGCWCAARVRSWRRAGLFPSKYFPRVLRVS